MKIFVDDSAAKWLRTEFGANEGDSVRILAKYGHSSAQPGFNLTLSAERLDDVAAQAEKDGVQIFVKDQDAWYFDGQDVYMSYDAEDDELVFDIH